jgi:shikimate kinase
MTVTRDENIILIGMPGAGKSTVGVLLAKATGRDFLDTDVSLQAREGRPLAGIIAAEGLEGFCQIEAGHILSLRPTRCVIATGGSAVYSAPAMSHLGAGGPIVYLRWSLPTLRRRLDDLAGRGVVMTPGQSLADIYARRAPLYEKWADVTIACTDETQDQLCAAICDVLTI